MGKVNVVIVDATGNKEQKVGLPDDIKCGIIMVKLVEKIKLPSVGPDGNPISYKFIHKVTGRQLLEAQTLSDAGIKDGDVLRLQPEITAGAFCPHCGNADVDGAFCTRCGAPVSAPQQPVNVYTPVNTAMQSSDTGKSKLILIFGIIAVSLFMFANLLMDVGDLDRDTYNFMLLLSDAGQALFMLDIVLYMVNRLKK